MSGVLDKFEYEYADSPWAVVLAGVSVAACSALIILSVVAMFQELR